VRGSGIVGFCGRELGVLFCWDAVKVELLLSVGFGCTAPSWRRERAKAGSEASRLIAGYEYQYGSMTTVLKRAEDQW